MNAVTDESQRVHPVGQPIRYSANFTDKRRLGVRTQVPRHPAAPPDRSDHFR